jgi:hypothetical protein
MGLVFYVRCVLRRTKASLIPNPSRKRSVRSRALATMLGKKYDHRGLKNTSDKSVDISGYCCVYFFSSSVLGVHAERASASATRIHVSVLLASMLGGTMGTDCGDFLDGFSFSVLYCSNLCLSSAET